MTLPIISQNAEWPTNYPRERTDKFSTTLERSDPPITSWWNHIGAGIGLVVFLLALLIVTGG